MLEIKQARPKETYKAVYVTEDNADEFRKLACKYHGEPKSVQRYDDGTIYKYDMFSVLVRHNCWYTENADSIGWEHQEDFDEHYEIV